MAKASGKRATMKSSKGGARGKVSRQGTPDADLTASNANGETPTIGWRIGQAEYDERVARLRQELANRQLDALILFHPIRMAYLSGFFHLSTERPMALVVPLAADDGHGALIPQLERDHIAKSPRVSQIKVYPEYPTGGTKHPMHHLADLLREMKLTKKGARVGYDSNGYLDINGYDGPPLSDVAGNGVTTIPAREIVDRLRTVKSPAELAFITESCVWGNLAHRLMHDGLAVGRSAMEISLDASATASKLMIAALGPSYQPLTAPFGGTPAQAIFTAGANTALPHGLATATGLRGGDVLSTYTGADVGGYNSELERTMILGDPTPAFARHFDLMMQLQQVAFDALRPGRTLAAAERDVSKAFSDLGVTEMQRHHTGHGIGLEGHEAPFIDKGDETEIVENMVLTVEPGLYVPGLAGFRHSDTVAVRATGVERLTYYPRDLESMVVAV